GQLQEAEAEYRAALRLSPQYATAAINLADLYRQRGRDSEGEIVLHAALVSSPRDAALHQALGLTLIRLKRPEGALNELHQATELEPYQPRYTYVYAVALHSSGQYEEAMTVLKNALHNHPKDRQILQALVSFSRGAGDAAAALSYAKKLATVGPPDQDLATLIQELRRSTQPRAP
ncbi:tetratricopeptide repeat protein, partial [Afipia felis]|uniref:tetratricopeptide repeat protein n=1 Tax=Afipia felis TaxID=1035 RepID=UPI001FCDD723